MHSACVLPDGEWNARSCKQVYGSTGHDAIAATSPRRSGTFSAGGSVPGGAAELGAATHDAGVSVRGALCAGAGGDAAVNHARAAGSPALRLCFVVAAALLFVTDPASGDSIETLTERFDKLEEETRALRRALETLKTQRAAPEEEAPEVASPQSAETNPVRLLRLDRKLGYDVLDPTTNINRKQRLILERARDRALAPERLHVHGAITAIANYQRSNRDDKFGYLMRHPTGANQVGDTVSEATVHSAQLGFTGTLGGWLAGHAMLLFDPEQSFGAGTNTDLERNQVQVRHAYVLLGDLDRSPFYASLGKQAVPFGLGDTVNPFTASTVWHAFGALANGVVLGYAGERLRVSVTGIQGGAQFRAANTPVSGTAVPSRLNNFALDAHHELALGTADTLLLGASYLHGTAYCQDFPVAHFLPCQDHNPAFDVYARLVFGGLTFKGEFARTTREWPGTHNPAMPEFPASRVTSFDIGAKYRLESRRGPLDVSAEFSRFVAGPDGAPWERQDQLVLGAAWFVRPSAKLFAEYIRVDGYAPLNFISGGNLRNDRGELILDRTHSERSAHTNVFLLGANLAF